MNDLDIVAVRIEHPCCIIAGIVFEPSLRRLLALASGGHSRFVEGIYLGMCLALIQRSLVRFRRSSPGAQYRRDGLDPVQHATHRLPPARTKLAS
jgi:hypothetical protein